MTIALIAHDSKKELMVQFCTAYCRILSQHKLVATGTTGKLIAEATNQTNAIYGRFLLLGRFPFPCSHHWNSNLHLAIYDF